MATLEFQVTQVQVYRAILEFQDIAVYRGTQVFQVTLAFLGTLAFLVIREAVYRDTQAVEFLAIQESAGILVSVDTLELVVILEDQAIQVVALVATQELAQVGIRAYQDILVSVATQAFLAIQDQALVAILE